VKLLSAELLKARTTRVPYVFVGVVMLLSGGVAAGIVGTDSLGEDPWLELMQGASFANIVATILGILIVTNEYRHGTINSTFLVEPARERVLVAKLVVGLLAGAVFAVLAVLAALAVAVPWLAIRGDESLPLDASAVEAIARLVALYALASGLGVGVGAIIQNQVGAIVATFVWFFVAEPIITVVSQLLADGVGDPDPVSRYIPGNVLQAIVGFEQGEDFLPSPGVGAVVTTVYVAAHALLGALAMLRRDP